MKSIIEYIQESVFDKDLVKKDMIVYSDPDDEQHLVIDPHSSLWEKCQARFDDILGIVKKTIDSDNVLHTGTMQDLKMIYVGDDCIVYTTGNINDYKKTAITVISPETIYAKVTCYPELMNIRPLFHNFQNEFADKSLEVSFFYYPLSRGWDKLNACIKGYNKIPAKIPETISSKAKDIIKKYIKPRDLKNS